MAGSDLDILQTGGAQWTLDPCRQSSDYTGFDAGRRLAVTHGIYRHVQGDERSGRLVVLRSGRLLPRKINEAG